MNHKHTPPGEGKPNDNLLLVEGINGKVQDCYQVIHSNIHKCTIVVEGLDKGQRLYKYFYFNVDSIIPVIELKTFFNAYMSRLAESALSLVDKEASILQLGNDIIETQDFLKDYSQGNYPSINADDYIKVRDLQVNQVAVIRINNSVQSVKRIK